MKNDHEVIQITWRNSENFEKSLAPDLILAGPCMLELSQFITFTKKVVPQLQNMKFIHSA